MSFSELSDQCNIYAQHKNFYRRAYDNRVPIHSVLRNSRIGKSKGLKVGGRGGGGGNDRKKGKICRLRKEKQMIESGEGIEMKEKDRNFC